MTEMPTVTGTPVLPTAHDMAVARELASRVAAALSRGDTLELRALGDADAPATPIPDIAVRLLLDLLGQLARGNAVTVGTLGAELTTDQAAALINVPPAALPELIAANGIASRSTSGEVKIGLQDALALKAALKARREATLAELVAHDQTLALQ